MHFAEVLAMMFEAFATEASSGIQLTTVSTAPPPKDFSRELLRERIDASIMRSFGDRRAHRTLRRNGTTSAWDKLEAATVKAATALWETADSATLQTEDLSAYCAFLARELEINEGMDLPADEDAARLRSLAPRALDALDAISGGLLTEAAEAHPISREVARAFGAVRAELMVALPHDEIFGLFARAA